MKKNIFLFIGILSTSFLYGILQGPQRYILEKTSGKPFTLSFPAIRSSEHDGTTLTYITPENGIEQFSVPKLVAFKQTFTATPRGGTIILNRPGNAIIQYDIESIQPLVRKKRK